MPASDQHPLEFWDHKFKVRPSAYSICPSPATLLAKVQALGRRNIGGFTKRPGSEREVGKLSTFAKIVIMMIDQDTEAGTYGREVKRWEEQQTVGPNGTRR